MGYVVGNWSPSTEFEVEKPYRQSDFGHNFYAGQTLAHDARVTLFAWMGDFSHPIEMQESGWSGQLAVPRDLGLNAELELTTTPLPEFEQLRGASHELGTVPLPAELVRTGSPFELEVTLPTSVAEAVELCFSTFTGQPFATVGYDSLAGTVFLRRGTPETPWSTGYRAAPVEGDTVHLRIVRDVSSIEVFINDCSSTISSFVFSPGENEDTVVTARAIGADAELTDVYWWELESN